MSRRTMLAPIRPSPIMPSCIVVLLSRGRSKSKFSCRAFHFPITPDQVVRGAVVPELRSCRALQFGNDRLRQRLAQLDAPLIERVDVPNDALGVDAMLVKCDELTQCFRGEPIGENRVRWPVTLEHAVRYKPVRR